ncbi:uncharacterized protein N7511_006262 [Penicillium nucicola]|uniref:uncharacterized protein n=1 Tax=Penicillium nucicola TaxID=1850975 RepID=UPI0025455784|nr:uncharacterized protein N7511_006262 [Penicillium nucicola]KAJ5757568.1 hypothetical protein N7511_006262 [Penicillium nucicola]
MKQSKQNHHFIPRFILRNFVPQTQPPASPAGDVESTKGNKRRGRDFLVNKIDLERCVLSQRPVSTEFSLVDLYRDPGFYDNPYHLEKKLSNLESQASEIIRRASNLFSQGLTLELNRIELDRLRKFLFLMKYRSSGMFDRYNHDQTHQYEADDRERMLIYMQSRGFTRPRDVWFDNLRRFLDVDMDPARAWIDTLKTQIYPDDAMMMGIHLIWSFLAFCEPMDPKDEFLLTENAYSIFEGPSTTKYNVITQKVEAICYTEYHNFAPISPRLIIVLRSHLLDSEGQSSELFRETRKQFAAAVQSQHLNPDKAGSILHDLPVRQCGHVYTASNITSRASFRETDRFRFQCFKLSTHHTTIINNLFLEEAYITSSIVYHSQESLKLTLEDYFKAETDGMKVIHDPGENRYRYLIALEKISRDLGSSASCRMNVLDRSPSPPRVLMSSFVAFKVAIGLLQDKETEKLPEAYSLMKPGANEKVFWGDAHQAGLMMILRTKVDRALKSSCLSNEAKIGVRRSIGAFFMTFPSERLWLYLKISRNMNKFDDQDFTKQTAELELRGIEDTFARYIASSPRQRKDLVKTMYYEAIV